MAPLHVSDRIEVEAKTQNLQKVREFLHAAIKRSALPTGDINKVVLAVDEAVANTIQHGYHGREDGTVEVQIEADAGKFTVRIIDSGDPYDSAKGVAGKADLDLKNHIAAGSKRGLGLFIMRKVMDEVSYQSRDGSKNVLTLTKYIKAPGA
ncbi:MAG: ATP-binding protein [Planctomycetes bacterium]|nr:ATP-binding protein [Planctomycetota bacterium]